MACMLWDVKRDWLIAIGLLIAAGSIALGLYLTPNPCPKHQAIWILVERHADGFIEFKKTVGPPDDYTKNASNYWIAHPCER